MATKAKKARSSKSTPSTRSAKMPTVARRHQLVSDMQALGRHGPADSMGTGAPEVIEYLGNQLCGSLWFAKDLTPEESAKQVHTALELLKRLSPRNELEAMLAVQAIATHNAAMDAIRVAMDYGRSGASYDMTLKHAAKLLRIFKEQAELINRMQRQAPLLAGDQSETQPDGEEASAGAEGKQNSKMIEQSETLCELQAFLDAKKAG